MNGEKAEVARWIVCAFRGSGKGRRQFTSLESSLNRILNFGGTLTSFKLSNSNYLFERSYVPDRPRLRLTRVCVYV